MDRADTETDFCIRCLPEDVTFAVRKAELIEGSDVFADMFSCCDDMSEEDNRSSTDIYESSDNVVMLVRLLREFSPALPQTKSPSDSDSPNTPTAAIPFILLPKLLEISEKYVLKPPIVKILHAHLAVQAPIAPLLVYGLATQYSLPKIVDHASRYLAFTPLETYTVDDIKVIPTAEAYHKLLQLQHYRKGKTKQLLMSEELFPYGYGACPAHRAYAEEVWDKKRRSFVADVESDTLVAVKMLHRLDPTVRQCKVCQKAWIAATDMLGYKCKRVARRISQLPVQG